MDLEMRPNTMEEFPTLKRTNARAHGKHYTETELEIFKILFQPERSLAVFDRGAIVGNITSYPGEMTVPDGQAPMAAVAQVGVQQTHRRRGILTTMMKRQLRDIHEWGEPLASLESSEGAIYGRFGYGAAIPVEDWTIERHRAAFERRRDPDGRLRFVEVDEARELFSRPYERVSLARPGMVTRNRVWWDFWFARAALFGEDPRWFHVIYERDGQIDGYVVYRLRGSTLVVREHMAATDDAYDALWRFCLDVDLTTSITAADRPVDDPLMWMLADPRALRRSPRDGTWLRLVDVEAALRARRYAAGGRLALRVHDSLCEWNDGTFELDGGPEGARCGPTTASPDLELSAADLAATFLGGVRFTTLARSGRVGELTAGAVSRADAMFRTEASPWCFGSA
jgi:predicted acetyltransferase